jgi:uncharacterized protein YkwD
MLTLKRSKTYHLCKVKINVTVLILLLAGAVHMQCSDEDAAPQEDVQTKLLQAINELRSQGCQCGQYSMPPAGPVSWNVTLERSARDHATDMYTNHYFSHLSLDGTPPIVRAELAGYTGTYVGENIGRGYVFVADVMEGWKQSESHCKNLMDTVYLEIGAAKVSGYWVLDLGRAQ